MMTKKKFFKMMLAGVFVPNNEKELRKLLDLLVENEYLKKPYLMSKLPPARGYVSLRAFELRLPTYMTPPSNFGKVMTLWEAENEIIDGQLYNVKRVAPGQIYSTLTVFPDLEKDDWHW